MGESREIRASRGVALLDRENPGWPTHIGNLDTLDMGDCLQCVLAKLYRFYSKGISELFKVSYEGIISDEISDETQALSEAHGFHTEDGESPQELTDTWKKIISERLKIQ